MFLSGPCTMILYKRQTPSDPKRDRGRVSAQLNPSRFLTPVVHHLRYDRPHGVTRYLPPVCCFMWSSRTKHTVVRHGFLMQKILLRKTINDFANADAMRRHP